jgi:hypothetical protein
MWCQESSSSRRRIVSNDDEKMMDESLINKVELSLSLTFVVEKPSRCEWLFSFEKVQVLSREKEYL